ncbi:hypothetical protein GPL17_36600 [Bradyrhizobium yuanmingense]|uniref:hypothetical protein n=1 Tax=Bradyrhizobium yuanmingense TaxID=108015 RepID=UPI0012F8D844|nr:hypothetical protein [Bradyrhizobium yuanmingense]MVT55905.1 hypothetical protein [Bradyrhizobium yuanmingense]
MPPHYLKAIAAIQTDEGEAVAPQMKNTSINNFELKNVRMRPDGQVMRPLHAARIKAPIESNYQRLLRDNGDYSCRKCVGGSREEFLRSPENSVKGIGGPSTCL